MHKIRYGMLLRLLIAGLILGCWKEHVALYLAGEDEPVQIYPMQLQMLPEVDQKALKKGIPLSGTRELSALLEDFLS